MITLEELTAYHDTIEHLNARERVTASEAEALDIASKMLTALIVQLESQAVSFTP